MAVTLTEAAAKHVAAFLAKRGKGIGLRLGVKVIVDAKSLPYIDGTELDYVREGLQEGFKYKNPQEKETCGCGKSFHV